MPDSSPATPAPEVPPPSEAEQVADPSYAAQVLTAAANALDEHPTHTLSAYQLTCALQEGTAHLGQLPAVVVRDAENRAIAAMPKAHPAETAAEYAVRLRTAAKAA
ncbi:hypothetical protein ACWEFL_02695 [Streptomyces sp. NPDC004838]